MYPDNKIFLCQYVRGSEDEYSIALHFNSIQAARNAAVDLLTFIGEPIPLSMKPREAPPHKTSEENTPDPDPLTQLQNEAKSFSNMLKDYRAEHKYSQRKMAELLGVSACTISYWENGAVIPSLGTQAAIRKKIESVEFNV